MDIGKTYLRCKTKTKNAINVIKKIVETTVEKAKEGNKEEYVEDLKEFTEEVADIKDYHCSILERFFKTSKTAIGEKMAQNLSYICIHALFGLERCLKPFEVELKKLSFVKKQVRKAEHISRLDIFAQGAKACKKLMSGEMLSQDTIEAIKEFVTKEELDQKSKEEYFEKIVEFAKSSMICANLLEIIGLAYAEEKKGIKDRRNLIIELGVLNQLSKMVATTRYIRDTLEGLVNIHVGLVKPKHDLIHACIRIERLANDVVKIKHFLGRDCRKILRAQATSSVDEIVSGGA
jgi:hypothetical protein